jgi:cbb3-type cytochrome oxidase subunit 3
MSFFTFMELLNTFMVLWMMAMFIGIVVWVYLPKNKERLESYRQIPFTEDDVESGHGGT